MRCQLAANDYRRIKGVTVQHNGLPVNLLLQERNNDPPSLYYCLSWRTSLPSGRNRRFYRSRETGFWTVPVKIALCIMQKARDQGMLDTRYDDQQVRHDGPENTIIDSRMLGVSERLDAFDAITCDQGEPDWGAEPLFVTSEVPDRTWRKIMIVDTAREFCTFRSATTDVGYKPVINCLPSPWRMDNAMQDAGAATIREFLRMLREL